MDRGKIKERLFVLTNEFEKMAISFGRERDLDVVELCLIMNAAIGTLQLKLWESIQEEFNGGSPLI